MRNNKLVPVEPTKEMIKAGQLAFLTDPLNRCSSIYKAMLAASPDVDQEPVGIIEHSDYQTAAALLGYAPIRKAVAETKEKSIQGLPVGVKLYLHPLQAREVDNLVEALERIAKYPSCRDEELSYRSCREIARTALNDYRGGGGK